MVAEMNTNGTMNETNGTNGIPKSVFIYGLKDPRDGQIYYVGKTNDLERRYTQHLEDKETKFSLYGPILNQKIEIGQRVFRQFVNDAMVFAGMRAASEAVSVRDVPVCDSSC